jgi:hypothetical protein
VYVPLIECQFRDPTTLGESERETTTQASGTGLSGPKCSFRRPSDFRRLSIIAKKILSKQPETQSSRKREAECRPADDALRHPIKKTLLDETNQLISAIDWYVDIYIMSRILLNATGYIEVKVFTTRSQ